MLIISRHQQILDILKREKSVTVARLAKEVFASEPTIRRDLAVLEEQGQIKRVYGGAVLGGAPDREIPYEVRAGEQEAAKAIMAAKAAHYLKKGDVVFLDGSSSASHMVEHIARVGDILVVTSGAKTAIALAERGVRVISASAAKVMARASSNHRPRGLRLPECRCSMVSRQLSGAKDSREEPSA